MRWNINSVAHWVAGIYSLVIGHTDREPHNSNNGVQDEGEKHVLVEGDSLAAKTPERQKRTKMEWKVYYLKFLCIFKGLYKLFLTETAIAKNLSQN